MNDTFPNLKSVEILKKKNILYKLIKLNSKAISYQDVLDYAEDKVKSDEICKTIVVKDKQDNKYAFLLKGDMKIDFKKIKAIVGRKVSIISFDDLIKTTGVEPGAVCPITLNFPLYVDERIFETENINFSSGDHLYGLEIKAKDLKKCLTYDVVDIVL